MSKRLDIYRKDNDKLRQHCESFSECSLPHIDTDGIQNYSDNDTDFVKYLPFCLLKCC